MSVRAKVFSIITGLTLIAVAAVYLTFHTILLRNYDAMDRNQMSQHLDRATTDINDDLTNLNTVNLDWATWDDSYNFMKDHNSAYVTANLVPSIFENLGLDVVLFVDTAGDVTWEGMSAPSGIQDIPQQMLNTLQVSESQLYTKETSTTGFIQVNDQALMVVSNPILTSNGDGPAMGFLVWGRFITNDYSKSLSQKTMVDIHLFFAGDNTNDSGVRQAFSELQNQGQLLIPVDDTHLEGYTSVKDLDDHPLILIKAVAPRDFLQQGNSTVNSMSLALGVVLAGIGIGFFLMLGHTVVAPLSSLSSAVAAIDLKKKEKQRVVVKGNDEIASLGKAINNTLDRLEDSQQALLQAAEEWRVTFDSINDPISIQDNSYRFIRVNKAFATAYGMEPKDLIGKKCYEVIHRTTAPPSNCPHIEIKAQQKALTREYYDANRDVHLEISMAPIISDAHQMIGIVQITKDITERKKIEGRLIVTDRLASLGEMAAGIAHEINNPLTGVIGFTELLLDSDLPETAKGDIRVIAEGSARVAEIVKRMLTFARQTRPMRTSSDINELIDNTLALQIYSLKISNIDVVKNLDSELPWLVVDPGQLQQVFLNLIINAQYAMKKAHGKGTLTITTSTQGDHISITLTDDGPGIPNDVIDKLFQPFFTTKEPGEGTGLGLSLSRSIVLEHGGTLNVISEPGKGATFIIELPRDIPTKDEPEPLPADTSIKMI